jgi:hypothetical protein
MAAPAFAVRASNVNPPLWPHLALDLIDRGDARRRLGLTSVVQRARHVANGRPLDTVRLPASVHSAYAIGRIVRAAGGMVLVR